MQRAGQEVELRADLRHALALIQQPLHFDQPLGRQPRAFPAGRRHEESLGAARPIGSAVAFDGGERHAEGFGDLPLRGRAVDDELGGEEAETGQVVGAMGEDGQVAVEINDLIVPARERQLSRDGGRADGKQRQLDLRHGRIFSAAAAAGKPETTGVLGSASFHEPLRLKARDQES